MGGCMSKLKPQGPSLNVYFKIAICRFLIRPFTCLFLLSCCYLELAIGSHALWHSVALTLSGRVIKLSQLWNSGKFKAKKPEVSVISSQQLASRPGEEVPVRNVHGFFTLCITAQWWALERRNWMLGLTTSYEVAYIHVGSAPLCLFS